MQGQHFSQGCLCPLLILTTSKSITRLEAAVYADPLEKLVGSRPAHKWIKGTVGVVYCQKHVLLWNTTRVKYCRGNCLGCLNTGYSPDLLQNCKFSRISWHLPNRDPDKILDKSTKQNFSWISGNFEHFEPRISKRFFKLFIVVERWKF